MGIYIANSDKFNITTEAELTNLLSHFNEEYIFDIIENNIRNRIGFYQSTLPNIPATFENNFKSILLTYPENTDEISGVREETYQQILDILARNFNITIHYDEINDLYSAAYYLYDFTVANFSSNIIQFFTNFILKEKNNLYESFHLGDMKKNKDSTTIYNKKLYKNSKLAIINANLDFVIDNICVMDITFENILTRTYTDSNAIKYLSQICTPEEFFKVQYATLFQTPLRPVLLTNIRLEIQKNAIDEEAADLSNR